MIDALIRWLRPTIAATVIWASARIAWNLMRLARRAKHRNNLLSWKWTHARCCHRFDYEIVRGIVAKPSPIEWLVARILSALRLRFAVNIAAGMGHNTLEIDWAMRAMDAGDVTRRLGLLRRSSQIHCDTLDLYGVRFRFASKSDLLVDWLYPAIAHYSNLRADFGLSRLKWHARDDGTFDPLPADGQNYFYQVSKAENRRVWMDYYRLRRRTTANHPLAEGTTPDRELLDFLGGRPQRLALVHLKYQVANATAAESNPAPYVAAVEWLQDNGYLVVQVGREAMPEAFREIGVVNYAESRIASYKHDLQIFSVASVAITAGSGLACIPDCMGIPYVYLDSWHLGMPMASERCVIVPALVDERATGRRLRFAEQCALYWNLEDQGAELFPADIYRARNASADEILAAVQEALALKALPPPLTALQIAYRGIDSGGLGGLTLARASDYFLRRHAALLDGVAAAPECTEIGATSQ